MASADDIANVIELLPSSAGGEGWTSEKVNDLLDAGNTINKVLLRYWNAKAADTYQMVSISESGSSRDLATIHRNATSMVAYWADKVAAEDLPETIVANRQRARSHIARRV